jgi:hypothetical protein
MYPPTIDDLIEQLRRVKVRGVNLPPELQKNLAELYEKLKTAQREWRPHPPEKIDRE